MSIPKAPYSNRTVNLIDLPELNNITLNPLHPKYPTIAVIHAAIPQVIFLAIFTAAFIIVNLPIYLWIVMISEIVISLSWSYVAAKRCRYVIREQDIISQKGLWQQKTTAVSFNRIQHIDISNDPLERKYQTATIKLFTAGGSSADLSISGLPQDIAQTIRQQVLNNLSAESLKQTSHHQIPTDEKENIKKTAQIESLELQTSHHQLDTDKKENMKGAALIESSESIQRHEGKSNE